MNPAALSRFRTISVLFARFYLLIFAIIAVIKSYGPLNQGILFQFAFLACLLFWRFRKKERILFIPDIFLFSLPYFWLLSLYPSASAWFPAWKLPFIAAFAISTWNLYVGKQLKSIDSNILHGIWCTLFFVLLFATVLRSVLPSFTAELFRSTVMNIIAFFGGIPICLTAVNKQ